MMQKKFYYLLVLLLLPSFILATYFPGLGGGFVFDDFSNILHPPGVAMHEFSWDELKKAALSMDKRPIARASFGLNHLASGFNPYYFKVVNIAIHSINALLVFSIMLLLLKYQVLNGKPKNLEFRVIFIAAAISTGWALHPVNLTNVLYSVQRMNSLSALFVLSGMLSYTCGRLYLDRSPVKAWSLISISVIVFLPLAWFSKENGALLPLFLFIIEMTFFRFATSQKQQRNGLYLFYILFLLLPALLAIIYILQHAGLFHGGYGNRYFSLSERLLTEPRVIWIYIRMILLPTPSVFGLFHDDIAISTTLAEPVTTLTAIAGLMALFVAALLSIRRTPVLAFGLLLFFAGHLMESTFIPLELAFEHRNYLPSLGLLMPLFYYLGLAGNPDKYTKARLAAISAFILLFALQTHFRAWHWSDNVKLYLTEVQFHPNSARANYEAGKVFGQRLERRQGDPQLNYRQAISHFERVTSLRNNTTSGLFGSILASIDSGHTIKPEWIDELEHRLGSYPLEQVNLIWLDKMTDCISKGKCRRDDLQIPRLLDAAIGYRRASKNNKSLLYAIYAKYLYKIEKNHHQAINMARKAVSLNPSNMYHRINFVKYLIWADRQVEARKTLESIKKADIYGQHTAEIVSLMKTLDKKNNIK